jgi:nicotinate-nucleotide adenylyltransferase
MAEDGRKRVGIMGGTFDPIHIGHLILGECAYEQFGLDQVLFMPSGNPPHKATRQDGAGRQARLEMTALAIADNPHFSVDLEEIFRSGYTYTNETLQILKRMHPDTDYYFIIGGDSLMALDSWRKPDIICQNCVLLVAVREDAELASMKEQIARLKSRYGADIHLLHTPRIDVSSTQLRDWCRQHRSLRYYIPDSVIQYIEANHVYVDEDSRNR